MLVVTYLSDFAKEYVIGLRQCNDLPRLREFALHWGGLCADAFAVVQTMTDEDWPEYRRGRNKESRGLFAGEAWADRYGAILMPNILFQVSMIAEYFHAPWGTAFLRCEQAGLIRKDGNVYVWTQREKEEP